MTRSTVWVDLRQQGCGYDDANQDEAYYVYTRLPRRRMAAWNSRDPQRMHGCRTHQHQQSRIPAAGLQLGS